MTGPAGRDALGGLEDLVCFDLYAASRSVTAAYRPILSELGLTYPQYLVVVLLAEHGHLTISEVARTLRLDHATLTPLLRRLEAAALVTRARDEQDARSVVVRLTDRGRRVGAQRTEIQCRVGELLGLDGAEVAQLQRLLRRVSANLA
ncbi:MarR family transcriptional regulator [Nocardioides nanhaiensis]|uniref:MarR family transcriptional regulator n=1 Tax=Nocardioides nanhaiensis TaxID=1476871 RepID=A0ABP8WKY0_9ACTN